MEYQITPNGTVLDLIFLSRLVKRQSLLLSVTTCSVYFALTTSVRELVFYVKQHFQVPKCQNFSHKELELALEEIVQDLDCDNLKIDAVYIPPNVDELTDEENFSDDVERREQNENADIAGTFEIHTNENDLYGDSDEEPLAVKRQRILEQNQTNLNPVWRSGNFLHQNVPKSKEEDMTEALRKSVRGFIIIIYRFGTSCDVVRCLTSTSPDRSIVPRLDFWHSLLL
ncbi:uncharacterized protein LOC115878894 [Sitophilus oryzae]|uniref:Uncharacterized protein LOC115878894 n=1 Tax=Sitophilus oryzae TaxID=7048 RepID=A0A6J2XL24_SITOR|nr:uncharacterized protein LOC115878894 [Sitophilus oryzae]